MDRLLATQFPPGSRVARSNANSGLPTLPASPIPTISRRRQYLAEPPPTLMYSSSSAFSSNSSSSSSSWSGTPVKYPEIGFKTDYFEVRKSPKKGYGAFAIKDIKEGTIISSEAPLFATHFSDLFRELEKLTPEQRAEYRTLAAYMKLEPCSRDMSIFMTNRYVRFLHAIFLFNIQRRLTFSN